MPRYSQAHKNAVLTKPLPPNNQPVPEVAHAEGISEGALYNWLSQVREGGSAVPSSRASNAERWSGEAKFAVVLETQPMNEVEKAEYCRKKVSGALGTCCAGGVFSIEEFSAVGGNLCHCELAFYWALRIRAQQATPGNLPARAADRLRT